MELVILFEDLLYGVYLQKLRSTSGSDVSTKIRNLIVELHISLLAKHTHCCQEKFLAADMLLLINRDDAYDRLSSRWSLSL